MADMRQLGRPQGVTAIEVSRVAQPPLVRLRKWLGGSYAPYLYVAPFFIIFFAFFAYPVAYSFYVSLHHWAGVGAMRYVGLGNYSFVLSDNYWWNALTVSGLLWLLVMPLGTAISLLVAVVFNRPRFFGRNVALVMFPCPRSSPSWLPRSSSVSSTTQAPARSTSCCTPCTSPRSPG